MKGLHISAVQYIAKANVVYSKVVSLYKYEGTVENQNMLAPYMKDLAENVFSCLSPYHISTFAVFFVQ
jgi:predicted amidophosphoribosyltransferase